MRGLTIARRLSRHEFLFVADDDAPKILEPEFPVRRLPNLGTVFKNYKVDMGASYAAFSYLWASSHAANPPSTYCTSKPFCPKAA